jgi:hypothetical protein
VDEPSACCGHHAAAELPAGTLIELCDLHSDRPSLRDLFPPESEFAGEPLLGSAL